MPANAWELGTTYYKTGQYSIFSQPGGAFSPVLPGSGQSAPFTDYPIQGLVFTFSPWLIFGCQHLQKWPKVINEYDFDNDVPVNLLVCSICTYIQRVLPVTSQDNGISGGFGFRNSYVYPVIVG